MYVMMMTSLMCKIMIQAKADEDNWVDMKMMMSLMIVSLMMMSLMCKMMIQAKAEEDNRVDMKNTELSATNDLSSVYR